MMAVCVWGVNRGSQDEKAGVRANRDHGEFGE